MLERKKLCSLFMSLSCIVFGNLMVGRRAFSSYEVKLDEQLIDIIGGNGQLMGGRAFNLGRQVNKLSVLYC